jgi:hypothetical protein
VFFIARDSVTIAPFLRMEKKQFVSAAKLTARGAVKARYAAVLEIEAGFGATGHLSAGLLITALRLPSLLAVSVPYPRQVSEEFVAIYCLQP